jgi:hypothetical protein
MAWTVEQIEKMSKTKQKELLLCLLGKRDVDGLNGRVWNASDHWFWEQRIESLLNT